MAERNSAITRSRGKPFFMISVTSASVNVSVGSIVSRPADNDDDVPAPDDELPAKQNKTIELKIHSEKMNKQKLKPN